MTDRTDSSPALVWLRRDLRLDDHPALLAAAERGGAVIPVFVLDPQTEALGAAHLQRLDRSLAALAARLEDIGSRLILRRGEALPTLRALIEETGAQAVHWSRLYDSASRERDEKVKAALKEEGIDARSFNGALIHEPWEIETGQGEVYKVYSPFARAARAKGARPPVDAPDALPAPADWPASDALSDWRLDARMRRGAAVMDRHLDCGEAAALARMEAFLDQKSERYKADRDRLDLPACSELSDALALGEISPRRIWAASEAHDGKGPEHFRSEILWREFAYHLLHRTPRIEAANWREEWDAFPWREDNEDAEAWRRGMTGVDLVDAAMRELYVTGRMHNRARMLTASYLTKHLMTHWKVGEAWFAETLADWDPASNCMGWQWVAGSGPDAAPFFRIFNPDTQAEKFDPEGAYRDHWLKGAGAKAFYAAIPKSWGIDAETSRPRDPIMGLKAGREAALAAYHALKDAAA